MNSYRDAFRDPDSPQDYHDSLKRRIDWLLWEELVAPYVRDLLAGIQKKGAEDYLDFACGTGRVVTVAKQLFPHVTAIDISQTMVEHATKQHPGVRFVVADVTTQPDPIEAKFDCVTMFRFLLNAEDSLRRQALGWISAHTRQGGYLIGNIHLQTVSVPGLLAVASHRLLGRKVNYLGREQTQELLESAGFRIQSWSGYRVLPTVMGRPLIGRQAQVMAEKLCSKMGLGRIGSDHVFVAMKM